MNQTLQRRAILVLISISIATTTLPFVIPSSNFVMRVVTTFVLYAVWFLLLVQSLPTRRQVLIGLICISSVLMTMITAISSFALIGYLLAMLAILGAILVAIVLPFSEQL